MVGIGGRDGMGQIAGKHEVKEVAWAPNPGPQTFALTRTEKEILYGGSRGGGKTDCGIMWLLYFINNPGLRVLVLRETYDDLVDWIDRAMYHYRHFGARKGGIPVQIEFPSGAIIRTGYLKGQSYDKYKGHEYQKMIIEELTQIPGEEQYVKLLGSLRSTVPGLTPQVFCTTNPDGIGRLWVKRRFVDIGPSQQPYTDSSGGTRIYIPARVHDNPALLKKDPSYLQYLEGIEDTQLRRAWLDGDWDAYEVKGAIYGSQLVQARGEGRICRIPIEEHLPVHTAWDLGINDYTSIIFFQVYGKEIRIVDFYYNQGEGLAFYAKYIEEWKKSRKVEYGTHFFPHDANIRSQQTGKTMVDYARDFGLLVSVLPRPADKWADITKARQMFAYCWFEQESCKSLVEHLELYRKIWDDKYSVFKDEPVHDESSHAADAFRYMITALPRIGFSSSSSIARQILASGGGRSMITGKQTSAVSERPRRNVWGTLYTNTVR